MARRSPDNQTLDLLSWEPPKVVRSYPAETIRAADLKAMIAKVTSAAMRDSGKARGEIAADLGEWLGESCSEAMLNAYASEARGDKVPSIVRFLGIAHATGDAQRMLQALAQLFDLAVIPARFVPAIEDAMISDRLEELKQRQQVKRREWKGAR